MERQEIINAILIMEKSLNKTRYQIELETMSDYELATTFKTLTRFMKKNKIQRPHNSFVKFDTYCLIEQVLYRKSENKKNLKKKKEEYLEKTIPTNHGIEDEELKELSKFKRNEFSGVKDDTEPFFDMQRLENIDPEEADRILALCLYFLYIKEQKETPESKREEWKQKQERNEKLKNLLNTYNRTIQTQQKLIIFYNIKTGNQNIPTKQKKVAQWKILELLEYRKKELEQKLEETTLIKIWKLYPFHRDFRNALLHFQHVIENWNSKSVEECYQDLTKRLAIYLNYDKSRMKKIS